MRRPLSMSLSRELSPKGSRLSRHPLLPGSSGRDKKKALANISAAWGCMSEKNR